MTKYRIVRCRDYHGEPQWKVQRKLGFLWFTYRDLMGEIRTFGSVHAAKAWLQWYVRAQKPQPEEERVLEFDEEDLL